VADQVPNHYRTPATNADGVLLPHELEAGDLVDGPEARALLGVSSEMLGKLRRAGRLRAWPASRRAKSGDPTKHWYLVDALRDYAVEVGRRDAVAAIDARVATGRRGAGAVTSSAAVGDVEFLRREAAVLEVGLSEARAEAQLVALRGALERTELERDAARAEAARLRAALVAALGLDAVPGTP
jgi:hypothetical protein